MNQWVGVTPQFRFWSKVRVTDDCWEWKASHDTRGYALLWLHRRWVGAHRFAYELLVGPIPAGLELDHLCRNKGCVNPAHLEPVTHRENSVRAVPFKRKPQVVLRTHCKHGHVLPTSRVCRMCSNERNRQYRVRQSEAKARDFIR